MRGWDCVDIVGGCDGIPGRGSGVRPLSAYSFEDQLGLVPSTKSKIEDGSDTGTLPREVVTVADFRFL